MSRRPVQAGWPFRPTPTLREGTPNVAGRTLSFELGLSAKGDVVIQIQKVEPSFDVSARLTERTYPLRKELKRFGVAVRPPFVLEARPLVDFPSSPVMLGVRQNPFQQFTVTLAGLISAINASGSMPR